MENKEENLKDEETFICEVCNEELDEECKFDNSYELLGIENICQECGECMMEDKR